MRRFLANSSSNSVWSYERGKIFIPGNGKREPLTGLTGCCSAYSGSLIPSNLSIALSWSPLAEASTDCLVRSQSAARTTGGRNLLRVQNDWVKVREYRLERGDLRIYGRLFDRFGGGRLYWSGINGRW